MNKVYLAILALLALLALAYCGRTNQEVTVVVPPQFSDAAEETATPSETEDLVCVKWKWRKCKKWKGKCREYFCVEWQ